MKAGSSAQARPDRPARENHPDEELITGFLTYRISILAKKLDRRAARIIEQQHGLKLNEWWVLGNVLPVGTVAIRELVQRIHIDKSQISRALTSLLKLELVQRTDDPSDARSPRFSLTAKGAEIREAIMRWRVEENERLAAILEDSERPAVDAGLRRMDDSVARWEEGEAP